MKYKIFPLLLVLIFSMNLSNATTFDVFTIVSTNGTELLLKPTCEDLTPTHNQKVDFQIVLELQKLGENVQGVKNIEIFLDICEKENLGEDAESFASVELSTVGDYITDEYTFTYDENWGDCTFRCKIKFTENKPITFDEDFTSGWYNIFHVTKVTNTNNSPFPFLISLICLVSLSKRFVAKKM